MIRPQTCGVCGKDLEPGAVPPELFPFCSERCRNIDLYRWCEGTYSIVEPLDEEHIRNEEQDAE